MLEDEESEKNETNAWAKALQYFIQNPERAAQLGNNAKKHVHKNFAWDQFVTTWKLRIEQAQSRSNRRIKKQKRYQSVLDILLVLLVLFLLFMFQKYNHLSSNNTSTIYLSEL